eukprot:645250-Amorphochlora_amoeboformis.AAC.1
MEHACAKVINETFRRLALVATRTAQMRPFLHTSEYAFYGLRSYGTLRNGGGEGRDKERRGRGTEE